MLEVGDVVYLKSNPEVLMTVSFVIREKYFTGLARRMLKKHITSLGFAEGDVHCRWFAGLECRADFFKAAMLAKKT